MRQTVNDLMDELSEEALEEQTFRNILNTRRYELVRIVNGERATEVIPQSNQRRKLRRDGVLEMLYGQGGRRIILTQEAVKALREMGLIE